MTDFTEHLAAQRQAEAYMAEAGGLPEIDIAATNLWEAIARTRQEILDADFASRFPHAVSNYFAAASTAGDRAPSPQAIELIDAEGEAGAKRAELLADLARVEGGLGQLIRSFVALRADLETSQREV